MIKFDIRSYTVPPSTMLLNDLKGVVRNGEILAIMGPSGSGKSTLLHLLDGHASCSNSDVHVVGCISGMIRVLPRSSIGFCPQHDSSLLSSLTVEQAMYFAARLQLPRSTGQEEINQHVERTLRELNLYRVRTSTTRYLSGGERRRLTLGLQLVKQPKVLFLDEPTSGLDSFTAYKIMAEIYQMAQRTKMTVVCTIHQPNHKILQCFDRVVVLSRGTPIFHGLLSECDEIISQQQSTSRDNQLMLFGGNTAEILVDLANSENLGSSTNNNNMHLSCDDDAMASLKLALKNVTTTERQQYDDDDDVGSVTHTVDGLPWTRQYRVLLHRFMLLVVQDPLLFWTRFFMIQSMAIVIGFLYFNIDDAYTSITDIVSSYFFMTLVTTFVSLTALPHSLEDKIVLQYEFRNGMYSLSAYVAANLSARCIFIVVTDVVFGVVVYYLVGIGRSSADQFAFFILTLLFANFLAEVFMLILGVIVRDTVTGIAIGVTAYGYFMLMSGTFVRPSRMNRFMAPFSFVSYYKYVIEALMLNSFPHLSFQCPAILRTTCTISGSDVLNDEFESGKGYFLDSKFLGVGVLLAFLAVSTVVYIIVLERKLRERVTITESSAQLCELEEIG